MLKTLKNLFKQDKEKFVVPKSVQSVIPIKTIWEDGIFLVGKNKYAKTFKFEDINYAVASREDKEAMFLEYSELLNSLDSGATTKITINNRRLNKADFEQTILIPMADNGLDKYRKEYNKMLLEKATGANSIVQDKYVTVSVSKKNIEEARNYFARVGADLIAHFSRLGSRCVELEAEEKLRIFHDFYRTGEETAFRFDISQTMRKGHDFKDFISPDTFEFEKDCFRMGDRYGRVIFLREYAAYIKDSMVAELCELNRNMMLSVDIIPVPTDEAVREVENRLLGVETNILKSEFILSLCEQLIGGSSLGAKQKSIIDRCTASVYRYYQQGNYMGTPPTLQDFREELLKQDEPEAQEIALAIELFTDGSLNTFAKHTNVDTHSRLICYDILDLGKQLQPIGMLVVLDSILNRITQNRAKGRNTFIFIDEIYLLFQHEYSANFLFTLWKRVRKYGAYCTGITQNVDDLLQSHTARTMLANSEFIIMLNQASTDRIELAKLLNISDLQLSYITNVGAGQGLLKVGSSLVPFVNKFPRNTELYKLMTTKFGEV